MSSEPSIPSAESDAWNIAEGRGDGKPSLIRYRPNLESLLGDPRYPRRLTITWVFDMEDASGQPSPKQSDDMRSFEDAIVAALDPDRLAILTFVYTNSGAREWHLYTGDTQEVGVRINAALSGFPKLPIELKVEDDPKWDELQRVYAGCQ